MKKTLQVIANLEHDGVIRRYAIGGAMAAMFYAEPALTFDLDVFVLLPTPTAGVETLTQLYDALRASGYHAEGEHVNVEGVPVQFLPAYNPLVEEALAEARETEYEGTTTRVLGVEHLIAMAVQTGREKDRERVRLLMASRDLDRERLFAVLRRHQLVEKWRQWTT